MADGNEPNGRVTTREFYQALMDMDAGHRAELKNMERRIMEKLDLIPGMCKQIDNNTKEIDTLRKASRLTDAINFLGAVIAGIIGARTGP